MTDRPINLNRYRKDRARAEKRARGDANAAKFGRTQSEKSRGAAEQARADRTHEGHRLERPSRDEPET